MDDLWDGPAVVSRASARDNEPLFLRSDDEQDDERQPIRPKPTANNEANDLDNIFAEFDDLFQSSEAQKALDVEGLLAKRAAKAAPGTNTSENNAATEENSKQPESDKEEKTKSKRTIAKVDEERLLGERGFPALIKEAKKFKPKGKGHEAADLDRLLEIYQFWAHHMFPKTQFRDTVDRVERVCRSRRMLINMSMWRDAEPQIDHPKEKAEDSDVESNIDQGEATAVRTSSGPESPDHTKTLTQASNRRVIPADTEDDFWADVDEALAAEAETQQVTEPPPSTHQSYPDEDDLEDWFDLDKNPNSLPSNTVDEQGSETNDMEVDSVPNIVPERFLSPPTEDNWDEDLFV